MSMESFFNAMVGQKWEYKVEHLPPNGSGEKLNELGEQGWELVSQKNGGETIFKRLKPSPPPKPPVKPEVNKPNPVTEQIKKTFGPNRETLKT